ncbi:DgyrCDS5270 [Dimorphilus gyrociliatus]|uniref:DgyrCDS5270 n=1 Tax=Dimorphilus gyrociliatus TaxID=2664684 RepID=A0A7I8VL08_9ANNE|nr:DgyrCDS5270 [Dimorphilus gyrociliatus]
MKLLTICLAFVAAVFAAQDTPDYEGYHVVYVIPDTEHQVEWLMQLEGKDGIDFLKSTRKVGVAAEIIIPKEQVSSSYKLFSMLEMRYFTVTENAAADLKRNFLMRNDKPRVFDINDFNTFEDILAGLDDFVARCPSGASCTLEDIGNSPQGRPIRLLKITKPGTRKIVWFDSAIHAREWLAPATNLKLLDAIISQQDSNAVSLFNKYDFYFVIVMNPDGYVYSWQDFTTRFWRKNRSPNVGSSCVGTDLNRNYDANWLNDGTSTNPCSDTYGGSSAASEVETQAVQNYLRNIGSNIISLTTIHTTAQMILIPYGHTDANGECAYPSDHQDQLAAANAFADGIENTFGTSWDRGTVCTTIYPASGATMDFAYDTAGIKYSFTPELRGPGFDPPASAIQPSFDEVWNGVVDLMAQIETLEGKQ